MIVIIIIIIIIVSIILLLPQRRNGGGGGNIGSNRRTSGRVGIGVVPWQGPFAGCRCGRMCRRG